MDSGVYQNTIYDKTMRNNLNVQPYGNGQKNPNQLVV